MKSEKEKIKNQLEIKNTITEVKNNNRLEDTAE